MLQILLLLLSVSFAEVSVGPNTKDRARAFKKNQAPHREVRDLGVVRPYAEFEKARYLWFSSHFSYDTWPTKRALLENLPAEMTAVVYTTEPGELPALRKRLLGILPPERLKILLLNTKGIAFWSRDALPIPVFVKDGRSLGLIDALYYHHFEADAQVAKKVSSPVFKHEYYFEGGNFASDSRGQCLMVRNHSADIPDEVFKQYYGCRSMTRLPYSAGIGHLDERVKLLSDGVAITDTPEYVETLERLGFRVTMLPRVPNHPAGTYVNSLLANGTIFLPIYQEKTDAEAVLIYETLGFKVVPLDSRKVSDRGEGSIHCITMTYPDADWVE